MMAKRKQNDVGQKVPGGGMVDMRAPVVASKVSAPGGVGAGYGFGSGHEGHRRKGGPHPHAPKNG
jgi:hypothetical protein